MWDTDESKTEFADSLLGSVRGRIGGGREAQEEGNIYKIMTDSHCHMPEINTTL